MLLLVVEPLIYTYGALDQIGRSYRKSSSTGDAAQKHHGRRL
jgi:hypothetical protein